MPSAPYTLCSKLVSYRDSLEGEGLEDAGELDEGEARGACVEPLIVRLTSQHLLEVVILQPDWKEVYRLLYHYKELNLYRIPTDTHLQTPSYAGL